MFTLRFGRGARVLEAPFDIFFCLKSYVANTPLNGAISRWTSGGLSRVRPWAGPVLVLKCADVLRMKGYCHFETSDFGDVAEYFRLRTY